MLIGWVGEGGGKQASVVEGGIFMNRLMMGVMKMMGYDDDASGLCEEKGRKRQRGREGGAMQGVGAGAIEWEEIVRMRSTD